MKGYQEGHQEQNLQESFNISSSCSQTTLLNLIFRMLFPLCESQQFLLCFDLLRNNQTLEPDLFPIYLFFAFNMRTLTKASVLNESK